MAPLGLSREQVRAGALLASLVLLALVPWWIASFSVAPEPPVRWAASPGGAAPPPREAAGVQGPDEGADAGTGEVTQGESTPDDDLPDDDVRDAGTARDLISDAAAEAAERGEVEVDLDGRCTLEVPAAAADQELRAWDHDECVHAPIAVPEGGARWVVVVASFAGEDFTANEVRDRAGGDGRQVLWSSHYPSLNPDVWVVVEGPVADEATAEALAERRGGGAYARALTEDPQDRFCIADDGCVGARRR